MEKSQSDLCQEVLSRFHNEGVLRDVILIGSWCIPLYKKHYLKESLIPPLRTMDIDFLVPEPKSIKSSVNIPDILKNLGFIVDFAGEQGYIRLIHPDLIVEFLVQEQGRGSDKPYPLPSLGLNAQPLRFLNLLSEKIIKINIEGIIISIPHPAWFAIHKLIVTQRRTKTEKADKDLLVALALLHDLINMKQSKLILEAYKSVSKKWQAKIINLLEKKQEKEILKIIKNEK
ncbi:MAG: nucleotidyltransferase domain-containing protein [Candidatus Omnitrophica bacterium]|nr:nucleotidyltransferase domain-containing protein [Candidatus Omnitrophota bacterium]MBU1995656.1 nucleotidyltransferase domain-containing protein [Candidatus Omnitrophota bacterium]MBU4332865.1 nucleotidyltransferase domain-containing protein [Candidatus Omnitrophota bacterium]